MQRRTSLMLIDSDPAMRRFLRRALASSGYQIEVPDDGASAIGMIASAPPEAVILTPDMSDAGGMKLIQRMRAVSSVPILVLLPARSEPDVIRALDSGADDCLAKPFAIGELLARLRKMLRQAMRGRGTVTAFVSRGLRVDLLHRTVSLHERPVELTPLEYDVLRVLVQADGAVLRYHDILALVWGPDHADRVAVLQRTVNHLRRKIEPDPRSPTHITNCARIGYRLTQQRRTEAVKKESASF